MLRATQFGRLKSSFSSSRSLLSFHNYEKSTTNSRHFSKKSDSFPVSLCDRDGTSSRHNEPSVTPFLTRRPHGLFLSYPKDPFHQNERQRQELMTTPRCLFSHRFFSSQHNNENSFEGKERTVHIGDTELEIKRPTMPALVPDVSSCPASPLLSPPAVLQFIRWMFEKDSLNQDMLLIGPPGPLRRLLALYFCELTEREAELVILTRDTTEADLKQRREISGRRSSYSNQPVVRAAIEGRVLILEGLERAERNILPLINNLLENREMSLDDGRFLVSPSRYQTLLSDGHTEDSLTQLGLVPVHPRFRVIGLTVPVPTYPGLPLDPPLRSRFQGKVVPSMTPEALYEMFVDGRGITKEVAKRVSLLAGSLSSLGKGEKMHEMQDTSEPLEISPLSLLSLCQMMEKEPEEKWGKLFERSYPSELVYRHDHTRLQVVREELKRLGFGSNKTSRGKKGGIFKEKIEGSSIEGWVETSEGSELLQGMMDEYGIGKKHMCLVGKRGAGKSALVRQFAKKVGKEVELFPLHRDLLHRELFQRRCTDSEGNTVWQPSPLVVAALTGRMCILDNVDCLPAGMLGAIRPLLEEGMISLFDGTRLIPQMTFDRLKEKLSASDEELNRQGVYPVHPDFSVVAIGCPSTLKGTNRSFVTPDLAQMFSYHVMPDTPLPSDREKIISSVLPHGSPAWRALSNFASLVDNRAQLDSDVHPLSTRQLLHIGERVDEDGAGLREVIKRTMLVRFMPHSTRALLGQLMDEANIFESSTAPSSSSSSSFSTSLFSSISSSLKSIGSDQKEGETFVARKEKNPQQLQPATEIQRHLVPNIVYFNDLPQQESLMSEIATDLSLGSHVLLIGNQGVGKNKVVDRFLEASSLPRQYLQLHRDVTLQTLTVSTQLVDGVVTSLPSPLITAATEGHVLVIDEADKAPTEVIAVLRSLVDGDMLLPDGRRLKSISPEERDQMKKVEENEAQDIATPVEDGYSGAFGSRLRDQQRSLKREVLPIHPSFRMIVLVNRPGWPFLGNDFFAECGDLFAPHVLDNPDLRSEINLLKSYAPNVPTKTLKTIAGIFSELREKNMQGLLSYPYSTREAVQVARHLEKLPDTPLLSALENVFAFDEYDKYVKNQIYETLKKFKLPVKDTDGWRQVGERLRVEYKERGVGTGEEVTGPKHGKEDPDNKPHVGGNTWAGGTGGRDTAGLGGKGGPYRLYKGHDIHQISDEEKRQISKEAEEAARAMGKRELQLKLKEIGLSKVENFTYVKYLESVESEISQVRAILSDLQSKVKDRVWVRNKGDGDLDDSRLVEGAAGEKNVFKRREESVPDPFTISGGEKSELKKKMLFVLDCSGSMYYFNSMDLRLERLLEAAALIMEGFAGFSERIDYSFVGHSGDSPRIPLIPFGKPPNSRLDRLKVLEKIYAHTQYCMSGDYTLEAAELAIKNISKEEGEDYYVVIISDANLQRYAISPDRLARIVTSDPHVHVSCVLISSLNKQAQRLVAKLPPGKGHVCFQTSDLPTIMNSILKSTFG